MSEKIRVLVTALGGTSHGQQILKALRHGELDYHIVGSDMTSRSSGRAISDAFVTLPPAGAPDYLESLERVIEAHGIQAVFHGCEQEMTVFSQNRERLEKNGVFFPVNPPRVLDICQNKARTNALLMEKGFEPPRYVSITSVDDTEQVDFLPAVLKPSSGGGGSAHVYIAQDQRELEFLAEYLLGFCPEVLAQEYMGTAEEEYTVGVLFGRDGELLNSIGVRRLVEGAISTRFRVPNRTGRADLGPQLTISSGISQGEVGKWPEVTQVCESIASVLGAEAPVNVQCRVVDGAVKVFEINPRFSGTTSLRAMAGYNEPEVLIRREVLGEEVTPGFSYREGTILRSLVEHWIAD